ncbi:MAG TPA: FAD-dependent oxidoreductase, partial [Bauldia sp.]|nr:FAD-dependent oxidoreductase [Bauldia sp.]
MTFDRHARIVIVGGGAVGCSIAFHLAEKGERDVLLLEKAQLTHGSTWHAAGLVGQLRGKRNLTRLMQNSVAVFDRLEKATGQAIDWKKVGSLRLAASPERWSEIRRSMTLARSFGFEVHSLSPSEARDRFPFIDPAGVVGAAFIPSDGYVDPYGLTQAYAAGARAMGVRIEEGVLVTGIVREGRRVTGVVTDHGSVGCEILVNAAGLWAKRVGELAGVALAAGVVEHQYFVTEKALTFDPSLTTLRDPDHNFYLKPDVGAFAIGGWEDGTKGCWRGRPPFDFARELFPPNMDRLELFALPAAERLPVLNDIGIRTIINGPIPVSADGEPIMGLAPECDNLFVACGFTAGIAASGGAGEAMANWIVSGDPGMDLWQFDVRRFGPPQAQARWLEERAIEAYGAYYKIHFPGEEMHAARGQRQSPVHGRLDAAGAVFGSKFGWERPNWFAPPGTERVDRPSFEGKPNWFDAVAGEHRAIRERVAIIDQTSFAKFEIAGPGAAAFLQRLADNDLSAPPGACTYTQLCNERGGIEADVTLMRLSPALFYGVTGSGFGVRDMGWIAKHMPADGSVTLREVTSAHAVLNVVGPRSRDVLQSLADDDLSNAPFPYLSVREVALVHARVRAARVGYL